jgi:peptide/nickel transport system substrate-binding protein
VVLIAPGDYPQINALSLVTADVLRRLGMKPRDRLDRLGHAGAAPREQGASGARRLERDPHDELRPGAGHAGLPPLPPRQRPNAWFGWPEDAEIERLRGAWVEAGDPAESRRIARR